MNIRVIVIMFVLLSASGWSLFAQSTWIDSLASRLKLDKEFYGLSINNDTLKILTAKPFSYYPFGEFNKPSSLKTFLGKRFYLSYVQVFSYCDESEPLDTLFRFQSDSSTIDFFYQGFYGEDPPSMQIAKASISGCDVSLVNGIHVGMTLANVFNIVIGCKMPASANSIVTIVADRALYGLTFYFDFSKHKLVRIRISSGFIYCEKDQFK